MSEVNESVEFIIEGDAKKDYYIKGVFLQAEITNRNGRIYPSEVMEKGVKTYTEAYIGKNRAFGELDHPSGPSINLDRVSHMIKELVKEGNDYVGKAKILDTPMGKIVKNLMDEGALLGVSSRGLGTLKESQGKKIVQSDFILATAADIVSDPSAPSAFVQGIMEGVDFEFHNGLLVQKLEETKRKIEKESKTVIGLTMSKQLEIFESFIKSI